VARLLTNSKSWSKLSAFNGTFLEIQKLLGASLLAYDYTLYSTHKLLSFSMNIKMKHLNFQH